MSKNIKHIPIMTTHDIHLTHYYQGRYHYGGAMEWLEIKLVKNKKINPDILIDIIKNYPNIPKENYHHIIMRHIYGNKWKPYYGTSIYSTLSDFILVNQRFSFPTSSEICSYSIKHHSKSSFSRIGKVENDEFQT